MKKNIGERDTSSDKSSHKIKRKRIKIKIETEG